MDIARVRQALTARQDPPSDPLAVEPALPISVLPDEWQARHRQGLRPAAVLVPLLGEPDNLRVLLTERAHHLQHHPGQIAFPGGRVEPDDSSLAEAALREAEEEVGMRPEQVEILGFLPPQWTVSAYAMTPVIGYLEASIETPEWRLDPGEVASVFEVPADYLFDPSNHVPGWREYDGKRFRTSEIHWEGHRIWGITARVIEEITQIFSND